jgi:NAD(P)-dependent dehydrogenase (short-subunit alcohol dehydrogenase family)
MFIESQVTSRRNFLSAAAGSSAALAAGVVSQGAGAETTSARATPQVLAGKTVLVTGAARGIGRAMAEAYARAGAKVALLDIANPAAFRTARGYRTANMAEFDAAVASVARLGGGPLKLVADVRDYGAMVEAFDRISRRFGRIDVAVANAGFVTWHPFEDGTPEQWREVIDTNVHGVWNTLHAAIPHMRRQGVGHANVPFGRTARVHGRRQ